MLNDQPCNVNAAGIRLLASVRRIRLGKPWLGIYNWGLRLTSQKTTHIFPGASTVGHVLILRTVLKGHIIDRYLCNFVCIYIHT